jgi:galactokinase
MISVDHISGIFNEAFPEAPNPIIVRSPGRVNIIGEHTDYNEGYVLPAAIDKAAYIATSLRSDNVIQLFAKDLNERFTMSLDDLHPVNDVSWPNYILGAVAQFVKRGIPVKGFNAVLTSDVPIGSGLSSSAAVECATIFSLNQMLKTGFDKVDMAMMAQKAEHEYAGVLCGIMDQFASVMGKRDYAIKLDCRSLEYEYVPFKLEGIKILLLDTNVKHSLASSEYNTRRHECDQAVEWVEEFVPGIKTLRDVTEEMLDKYVLPKSSRVNARSKFVVQENKRLLGGCEDLQKNDINALGRKMFETHEGLRKMYAVSCNELDFLVDYVRGNDAVIGARMMGGGFGGCTINLVKEACLEELISEIKPAYEKAMNLPLTYHVASIENGTELVIQKEYAHV